MNIKRLILAIAAAFIFSFASDFLIHAIWLAPDYKATAEVWRSDPEMQSRFGWMVFAHLLGAVAFAVVWAKGAWRGGIGAGATFGLWMGLFQQVVTLFMYVVMPLRGDIALKWFLAGLLQAILLGIIIAAIYKPRAQDLSGLD